MFESVKTKLVEKYQENKNKVLIGAASAPVAVVGTAVPAFAADETAAFTTGVTNFMSVVSTIMNTIVGSPILMIFVGAAAATVALSLVRRLIGRM